VKTGFIVELISQDLIRMPYVELIKSSTSTMDSMYRTMPRFSCWKTVYMAVLKRPAVKRDISCTGQSNRNSLIMA